MDLRRCLLCLEWGKNLFKDDVFISSLARLSGILRSESNATDLTDRLLAKTFSFGFVSMIPLTKYDDFVFFWFKGCSVG